MNRLHDSPRRPNWKLWLPLPNRFGPQRPDLLKGLNITETEFKLIKTAHMMTSVVPFMLFAIYLKDHQIHFSSLFFVIFGGFILFVSYLIGAYILGLIWARIDANRPRYY